MTFEHRRGSVAELHGLDPLAGPPGPPRVWWCDPVDDTLVLGSRQTSDVVDAAACDRARLSIVRRRSGGGAVIIEADAVAWADIVVPHGVAPDDVRGSMVWAGELWRGALDSAGIDELEVHEGSMVCTAWSNLVCFAGIGPGEVLRSGAKLVGLSQRRTRHGLRIQGTLYRRRPSVDIAGLFAVDVPVQPLTQPATVEIGPVASLIDALAGRLAAVTR